MLDKEKMMLKREISAMRAEKSNSIQMLRKVKSNMSKIGKGLSNTSKKVAASPKTKAFMRNVGKALKNYGKEDKSMKNQKW